MPDAISPGAVQSADCKSFDRIWWWRKWQSERKGNPCRIVARGTMNAALVEFPDGAQVVTIRYAVRLIAKDAT